MVPSVHVHCDLPGVPTNSKVAKVTKVSKVTKMVEIRSGRGAEAAHMYSRGPRSEEIFLLYKPMCVRLHTMH